MIRYFVRWMLMAVVTAAVWGGIGCQTVKGVGRDIENAGEGGERAISGSNDDRNGK